MYPSLFTHLARNMFAEKNVSISSKIDLDNTHLAREYVCTDKDIVENDEINEQVTI